MRAVVKVTLNIVRTYRVQNTAVVFYVRLGDVVLDLLAVIRHDHHVARVRVLIVVPGKTYVTHLANCHQQVFGNSSCATRYGGDYV